MKFRSFIFLLTMILVSVSSTSFGKAATPNGVDKLEISPGDCQNILTANDLQVQDLLFSFQSLNILAVPLIYESGPLAKYLKIDLITNSGKSKIISAYRDLGCLKIKKSYWIPLLC
jgi:hypothetical protein